jgi:hypothetical protein
MVVAAPVPNDEVAGPAGTAWLWPSALADLGGYGAHVVVFGQSNSSILEAFRFATRLAASVVRASGALGVYMGKGGVIRGDLFVDMARRVSAPVALWIDMRCSQNQDGSYRLFTTGLSNFELMELEIASANRNCGDLRMWVMEIAGWLIEEHPTVNDGETIGLSAEERVLVRHGPSFLDRAETVWQLSGL